jgi:cullin-associated NEDD8-dissociated protein 1
MQSRFADREPTVRYEVWSAFTVLLRQTRQFASDKSNYEPTQSNGDYVLLPASKELLSNVTALIPKLLKPMLKTLSPKSAPPIQALVLLNTLLSELPKGSPRPYIFDSHRDVLDEFAGPLFKILVHPEALPTFTHLVQHAVPPEDVKSKLVTLMHERHPRVAADAIRAGIKIIHDMNGHGGDRNEFVLSLQKEARERLKSAGTDAAVREVSAKAIGALLVSGFACDPEDWELVRRAGAISVVGGVIRVLHEQSQRFDMAEEWLEANIKWCVELIRKGTAASKVEAMHCLMILLDERWVLSHLLCPQTFTNGYGISAITLMTKSNRLLLRTSPLSSQLPTRHSSTTHLSSSHTSSAVGLRTRSAQLSAKSCPASTRLHARTYSLPHLMHYLDSFMLLQRRMNRLRVT